MRAFCIIVLLLFRICGCVQPAQKQPDDNKQKLVVPIAKAVPADSNDLYTKVDMEPRYMGSFRDFLEKNLRFPTDTMNHGLCGSVIVLDFIVRPNGTVSDIRVADHSPGKCPEWVNEFNSILALSSGNWQPGMVNGKPVSCRHQQQFEVFLAEDE
jgi:hypothetical protein